MTNVVHLVRPIDLSRVIEELNSITNGDTTGIAIISCSPDMISVRTFGEREKIIEAVKMAVTRVDRTLGGEEKWQKNSQ